MAARARMTRKVSRYLGIYAVIGSVCAILATGVAHAQVSYSVLHNFTVSGTDGRRPVGPLMQATDGNFYGTTSMWESTTWGTVFRLTPSGTLTTLYAFTGEADGHNPQAGLLQASDGNFYGTTSDGGASNVGTVFRLTPSGTLTTLHAFTGGPMAVVHPASLSRPPTGTSTGRRAMAVRSVLAPSSS